MDSLQILCNLLTSESRISFPATESFNRPESVEVPNFITGKPSLIADSKTLSKFSLETDSKTRLWLSPKSKASKRFYSPNESINKSAPSSGFSNNISVIATNRPPSEISWAALICPESIVLMRKS